MFSATLFKIGPFNICFWNLIFLAIIFLIAAILRRVVHKLLKKYAKSANINIQGRRLTWLKLISQSVYLLAIYVGVLSFKFNNKDITFGDFLDFKLIDLKSFQLDFYDILVIVSVFYGARILVNLVRLYLGRKFRKSESNDLATEYVYMQVTRYVIYVFSLLFCFQILEIDLTLLLTGSAALLVGVGLGLQDVFKDMFAGVVLLFEGNIRVGDIVEINSSGKIGKSDSIIAKIVKINVRTTQIQTRDGNVLIIPNSRLTQDQVENWSHGSELSRFKIDVTVNYGTDMELVQRLLKQAALAHPKVKSSHPVSVILNNFGESGLEIQLIFWADQSWDIAFYQSEIRFEIDRLFREHKIVIPYPKRSVIIDKN